MKKKFQQWHSSPLVIPRSVLTVKYLGFAILGVLGVIGGMPTLDLLTFQGYTVLWCALLVISGVWGAIYSFDESGEKREKYAAVAIAGLILTWSIAAMWRAIVEGDIGRVSGAFSIFLLCMFPGARALGLLRGATK